MRTERKDQERASTKLQRSKHLALMAQHSVLSFALCAMLFVLCYSVEAQQPAKVPRIGFLTSKFSRARSAHRRISPRAPRACLRRRKDIAIEWRYAEGNEELVPKLAAELVQLNVEIIVTDGTNVTRAAKNATKTIPIVMASDADPVGNGFVASLARPGGNVTGLVNLLADLSGKRLELLKEAIPGILRVASSGTRKIHRQCRVSKKLKRRHGHWRCTCNPWKCAVPTTSLAHSKQRQRPRRALSQWYPTR